MPVFFSLIIGGRCTQSKIAGKTPVTVKVIYNAGHINKCQSIVWDNWWSPVSTGNYKHSGGTGEVFVIGLDFLKKSRISFCKALDDL